MATIVCQQQQSSYLESQRLMLKLSPPPLFSTSAQFEFEQTSQQHHQKYHLGHHHHNTTKTTNTTKNSGGWTFLQSISGDRKPISGEPTYVHPLNKRSAATILSNKSLELCTENLGNETGTTDTTDGGILSNTWCAYSKPTGEFAGDGSSGAGDEVGRRRLGSKSARESQRTFPPPLTTISGRDSIQVRPHREDGRLIIKAVKGQSRLVSCFRADRSEEGRLRLCLLEDYYHSPNVDSQEKENEIERFENEYTKDVKVEAEDEDESEKVFEEVGGIEKEKSEIARIEKFGMVRGGRCKESGEQQFIVEKNKSVLNLESFWLAT